MQLNRETESNQTNPKYPSHTPPQIPTANLHVTASKDKIHHKLIHN